MITRLKVAPLSIWWDFCSNTKNVFLIPYWQLISLLLDINLAGVGIEPKTSIYFIAHRLNVSNFFINCRILVIIVAYIQLMLLLYDFASMMITLVVEHVVHFLFFLTSSGYALGNISTWIRKVLLIGSYHITQCVNYRSVYS